MFLFDRLFTLGLSCTSEATICNSRTAQLYAALYCCTLSDDKLHTVIHKTAAYWGGYAIRLDTCLD